LKRSWRSTSPTFLDVSASIDRRTGYLAAIHKNELQLRVGFANEIHKPIPAGLTVTCPDQTHIIIKGTDRQKVGQFAAEVRAVRKPEPYKGKGIRYDGEQVRRKAGKTAK
jgi:large subunit ribosomal protein L6